MTPKREPRIRRPRAVVYRGTVLATADVMAAPEEVFRVVTTEADHGWADSGITAEGAVMEIDPPRMIVQKLREGIEETTVTLSLAPISSGTRVTVRHEGFSGNRTLAEEYAQCWEKALIRIQSPQGGAHVQSRQDHA